VGSERPFLTRVGWSRRLYGLLAWY
jgi:hypothetical protein